MYMNIFKTLFRDYRETILININKYNNFYYNEHHYGIDPSGNFENEDSLAGRIRVGCIYPTAKERLFFRVYVCMYVTLALPRA